MEKALSFLSRHKDVAFATVEENKPKNRVFQIMKREKATLYFATVTHGKYRYFFVTQRYSSNKLVTKQTHLLE